MKFAIAADGGTGQIDLAERRAAEHGQVTRNLRAPEHDLSGVVVRPKGTINEGEIARDSHAEELKLGQHIRLWSTFAHHDEGPTNRGALRNQGAIRRRIY